MAFSFESWLLLWGPVVLLAVLVPTFVAALLIMISRFLDVKHLEQAAKTELVYAGSTIFLVLGLIIIVSLCQVAFLEAGNNILSYLLQKPVQFGDLIDMNKALMQPRMDCMRDIMGVLYHMSIVFEMTSTTYIEVYMSEVSSGFIYKLFTERINNTTSILTFYMYIYYLIVHILNFMKYTALSMFLPIGILMRAFPPTRGAGAYIIAFALGIYFIFPLSYILMSFLPYDYLGSACMTPADTMLEGRPVSAGLSDQEKAKEAESWAKRNMDSAQGMLDKMATYLKSLTVSLCFTPLMALVITLTFVLSSTSLFGGNIPEVGRGLVKLI